MTTIEQRFCLCGLEMWTKSTRHGAFYECLNCDRNPKDVDNLNSSKYSKKIDLMSRGWYPKWVAAGSPVKMKKEENK